MELWRLVACVGHNAFARLCVEASGSVPDGGGFLGRLVAFSFYRVKMKQFGTSHILELTHDPYHFLHIVPVEGSEVADVHALKDILLMADGTLQGIVESDDSLPPVIVEIALGMQPL